VRILGLAFEQACVALHRRLRDDVRQAIANKIIDLAKTGERNPDLLCEGALKEIDSRTVDKPVPLSAETIRALLRWCGYRTDEFKRYGRQSGRVPAVRAGVL
jgi:hypothetical protein